MGREIEGVVHFPPCVDDLVTKVCDFYFSATFNGFHLSTNCKNKH